MFLLFFSSFLWSFILHLCFFNNIDLIFLYDPVFYLLVFLEIFIITLSQINYSIHSKNFSNISFAIFSSVYLIPVVSYFYFQFLDINENIIKTYYSSFYEALLISLIFFILNISYFYDKIKLKTIKKPYLLLLQAIVIVNVMFFSVFIIQKYTWFLTYSLIFLIISLIYLLRSLLNYKKEIVNNKKNIFTIKTLIISQSWLVWLIFGLIWSKLVAVEFVTFFKRLWQIINWYIFDKYLNKQKNISKKDKIIILLIIFFMILIFILKNNF